MTSRNIKIEIFESFEVVITSNLKKEQKIKSKNVGKREKWLDNQNERN